MNALRWIAVISVVACGYSVQPARAAESVLVNPGFETGTGAVADAWTSFGKNAARAEGSARGGIWAGKAFGEFSGAANYAGFFQNIEAAPGEQWVASLWMRHNADDPLTGKCEAFVKLEFYDANHDFIDSMESADRLTSGSTVGTYIHSGITSVAPPHTASVRIVAMFTQNDGKSKGAVFFDDAELSKLDKK